MYAIRTTNCALLDFTEIDSGIARRVAIHAMSGNTIPKTMSTTTAPVASKLLFRKRTAKAQTYRIRLPIRTRLWAKRWELVAGYGISAVRCTATSTWIQTKNSDRQENDYPSGSLRRQSRPCRNNVRVVDRRVVYLLLVVNSDVLEPFAFWSGSINGDRAGFAIG